MNTTDKNEALSKIKSETKTIRKWLGERVKKQLRITPEIIFYIDDNVDYANHMEQVFSKIEIPKKEDNSIDPSEYPGLKD
jgi:ribosome-binding factor A